LPLSLARTAFVTFMIRGTVIAATTTEVWA
jgi:hypothetical protein